MLAWLKKWLLGENKASRAATAAKGINRRGFLGGIFASTVAAKTGLIGKLLETPEPIVEFDPILISLIQRSIPSLMAYHIMGVQPMTGPTGLIFTLRSRYTQTNDRTPLYPVDDTPSLGEGLEYLGLPSPVQSLDDTFEWFQHPPIEHYAPNLQYQVGEHPDRQIQNHQFSEQQLDD
jgi:hypothetical protein